MNSPVPEDPPASPVAAPDWQRFDDLRGDLRRRHAAIEEAAHLIQQELRSLEFARSLEPGRFVRLRTAIDGGRTFRVVSVRPDAETGVAVEVRPWDAPTDAPSVVVTPADLVIG